MDYVKRYYWQPNDVSELGYGCMYDQVEGGTIALVPEEAFEAELANRKHWMELSSENQCRAASESERAHAALELCREAMSRFTGTPYDARVEELLNEVAKIHNTLWPGGGKPIVIEPGETKLSEVHLGRVLIIQSGASIVGDVGFPGGERVRIRKIGGVDDEN